MRSLRADLGTTAAVARSLGTWVRGSQMAATARLFATTDAVRIRSATALLARKPALWGVLVDGSGKLPREPGKDLVPRQASLLRLGRQHVRSDRLLELGRSDLPVGAVSHPRVRHLTLAILPEAFDQLAETATKQATHATSAEVAKQTAQPT